MKKVFGLILKGDIETVKAIHAEYLKALELDSKPEKGERKLADDLVILINEILEQGSQEIDQWVLYRIGLLEYALEKSPYNFDINLQLVKIYDRYGLSPSFQQAFSNLGIKGVQLESMGHVQLRHVLNWGEIAQYKSFSVKYAKFFKLNMQNLKSCKLKALQDNNYDQIENFIEYESFIANSYLNQIFRFYQYLVDFIEQGSIGSDYAMTFFANMTQQLAKVNKTITDHSSEAIKSLKART